MARTDVALRDGLYAAPEFGYARPASTISAFDKLSDALAAYFGVVCDHKRQAGQIRVRMRVVCDHKCRGGWVEVSAGVVCDHKCVEAARSTCQRGSFGITSVETPRSRSESGSSAITKGQNGKVERVGGVVCDLKC